MIVNRMVSLVCDSLDSILVFTFDYSLLLHEDEIGAESSQGVRSKEQNSKRSRVQGSGHSIFPGGAQSTGDSVHYDLRETGIGASPKN